MGIKLFGENQPAAWQDKTGTNTIAANAGENPFAPEMDENAEPGKVSLVHTPHQQFSMGQTDFKVELDQGAEAAMLMDANKDINRFFIDEPRMKCKQYLDGLGDTSQMDDATLKGHANAMMDYILGGLSDRAFGESTPKMTGAELFKRMSEYANGSADALKSPEQQAFEAMTPEEKIAEVERANKGKFGYIFRRNRANRKIQEEYEKTLKPEELADFKSIMEDTRKFRDDPELVKRTEGTRKAYWDLVNADEIKQHQEELEQKSIINTLASKTFRWLSDDAKKFVTAHLNGDDFNWEMFNTKVRPEEQDAVLAALHLARGEKEINGVFGLRPGGVEGLRKALPTDKQDDVTRVLYGATQGFWSRIGSEVWHGGKNLVKEWIVYPWYSEAERKKAYANLELESKVRDAMDRPWKDPESFAGKLIASYGDNFGFQMIGGFGAKGAQIATRGAEAAKMGKATGLFGWLGSRAAKAKEGVKAAEALTGASEGAKAQVALLKAHDAARKAYQAADKAVEAAKDALEMARAGKGKLTADAALKALDGALSTRAAASEKSIQTFRKINGGINATREAIEGAEFYNKILAAQKAAAAATRTIDRTASVIKGAAYTGENALWFVPFYDQQVRRDVANGIPIEVSLKTRWVTMLACGWAEKAVFTKMGQSNLTPQMLTATSNRAIKEAGVRVGKDIWNKVQGDVAATLGRDFKALEMAIANRIKGDVLHGAGTAINVTAQSMLDEVLNKMGEVYERNAQIHGFISKEAFLAPFGDGKMLEWTQTCLDVLDNSEFSAPAFAVLSPIGMRSGYRRRAASEREYQRRMGNTTGLPWENANINTDAGLVAAKNNLDGAVIAATKYLAGEAQKREQMIQQQGVEVPADYRGEDKQKQKTISDRLNGIIAKVFEIGADTKGKRSVERIMDECKVDRPTAELLLGVANDYAALDGPLQDAKRMYYDFLRSWKIKSPKLVAKEILEGMIPGAKRVQMTDDGLKFDIEMGGENIEFGYRTMEKFTADDVAEMITDNSPVGIEYDTLPAKQKERGEDGKIVPWKMLPKDRRTEIVVNHLSGLSSYGKGSGKFYMTEKDGTKRYIDVDELIQISGDGSYAGSPRHETAHSVLRVAERLGYFTQEDKRVVADVLGIDTESDAAKEIVDGGVPRWVVEVDEALAEGYREHTMGLSTPAWNRLAEGYDGASVIMKGIIAGANKVADYLTKSVATRPEWMPRSRNNVPVLDKFYDAMFRGDIENLRKMLPGTDEAKAPAAPAVSPELAAYNKAVEEYKFQKALAGSGNTNADVEGAKQRMNEAMNALRAANKKRREEKVAAMGPRASLGNYAGININVDEQDFVDQILRREKTIETRQTNSLDSYVGKDVGIVRTKKGEQAQYVGRMVIGKPVVYTSAEQFDADYEKHRISPDSPYHFSKRAKDGKLYGYPLTKVREMDATPLDSTGIVARDIRASLFMGEYAAAHLNSTNRIVQNLDVAKQMLGEKDPTKTFDKWNKMSRDEQLKIAMDTGWEIGRDGHWRHEWYDLDRKEIVNTTYKKILDAYKEYEESPAQYIPAKLGMFLDKSVLEVYPQLADYPVHFMRNPRGTYLGMECGTRIEIYPSALESVDDFITTLTHEVQHKVQNIEGFARGTTPEFEAQYIRDTDTGIPTYDEFQDAAKSRDDAMRDLRFGIAEFVKPIVERYLKEWYSVKTNEDGTYDYSDSSDVQRIGSRELKRNSDIRWAISDHIIDRIKDYDWDIIAPNEYFDRTAVANLISRLGLSEVSDIYEFYDDESKVADGFVRDFDDAITPLLQKAIRMQKYYDATASDYFSPDKDGRLNYNRSAGEVEARNAEERLYKLSQESGLMIADTEDTPRSKQIVRGSRYDIVGSESMPENTGKQDTADINAVKVNAAAKVGASTRYCLVSGLEGSGLTYETDANGRLKIILPNGKKITEKTPATAEDLMQTDSMLMHLIDLGIKHGTIGSSQTEGNAFKRNIADAFAQCFNLAAKWGRTNEGISAVDTMWRWIADETFKAIKSNSDKQYGTSVDILTICKKTDMLMQVVSDYMKKQKRGAMPTDIMHLYDETGKGGFQTPCPVCYVFSRWIRAGYDRQTAYEAQNMYKDAIALHDPNTAAGKRWWKKEYEKYFIPDPKKQKLTDEQKARDAAITKAKETLILGYQKFDEAMRKGDRTTADQLNAEMADAFETIRTADIAGFIKYCIYDVDRDIVWNDFREVPTDILFDFREAVSIANDYPALKRFYGSKGSAGGKAIETEARNDLGDVVTGIATDGGIETYEKWTPEYEAQLLAQSQEKEPDPKNPGRMKKTNKANAATAKYNARNWLKVAYSFPAGSKERADALKKFDDQFTSALAKSIRQNLIGGQRFFSWSDNRVEFGFDMMMNLMQIQLLGDSIQSYSKQLEGAELLAKHGAYNNGSLMGAGNGLEEAKPGEPGAVEIGGKWMKLKFSDIQGINHTALFELNKQYDKSGNILVGMNDDHIRVALRDERVFFIIPWHASGLGTGLLDHMLTSLGEDAHGSETDYSSYQSEKFLAGATPDAEIVSLWDRAAKGGKKFKSCIEVTHKQGEVTKSQLDYRAMRQAILLGKASQEMIDAAMKDEFLSQIVLDLQRGAARLGPNADSTYVNKNLKVPMLKMAGAAVDAVYPYEYWDRGSTYGKASVNSARYLEYCRRLGVLPKFCGIMVEKGVAKRGTYGNFTDEANYWKLLIDRRMYANGRNKDGSFKDFASGKYQHTDQVQMATANRSFDIDTINPQAIERKWGKLVTKKANAAQVGSIVDKVIEKQKQQGYSLATRSVRASLGIPPGLSGAFKTDDLLAMAAAGRLAKSLSGRESVRQDIDRRVRAIYEGASESELNNRITAIMAKAEQDALAVDKDFKQDNRDAEVLNAMTRRQVERYMRSLEGAGKQGLAVGARSEAARQELDRRIERKIQDSVAAQTGIAVNELESSLGVDLAETMVRIHDIENQAAAQRKKDNPEADKDEAEVPPELAVPVTDEERAEAERIIRDMVDGIVGKAWQETEEEAKKREERKRKAAEAKSDADEDADGEDIADITGEERLAKFILEKYPVDLRNPEHFAKFIALLAERKWRTDHGLSRDEYIWGDPVALQHLRMTAVNVYDALARKLMYSSKRETAMESIGRIGEAPNYNSVVNEMSFAGKVIAQGMVRETANELVKDLEQLLTQGFGANGRFKQNEEDIHRKVTGRTELWARDVKKVLRWSPEKVANEIDKIRERMQGVDAEFLLAGRDPNSSKQFDKDLRMISALQEFGGMLHKPLGEITDARVKILDRLDADKVAEEAEARDQRTKEMSALLGKAFDSGRKMAFDQTKLSAKIGNYFQEHLDFKHLLQDLARFCKDADTKNATLEFIDNLQHDVQRRWDKARTEERVQMLGFQEAVCAIYGTKNYHKVIADLLKHDERFDKFGQGEVNEDTGVATMVKMSKASAMQLYVAMQQKGYIGNIKANHREGQAIEIRKLLTKEDLALLKWLGDWYDKERDGISEVSMRLFGLPVLAEESNYFPVKVMVPTQGLEKGAVGAWNPFPPSLTPRVKHGYDFDVRENIISMWTSRMTQQAQWKAMAELGIEMRGIFGRQSLQSTIRRCHGEQALKNVLSFITDILNGQSGIQSDSLAEKTTLDKMRSAAAICALGGNLGVMLKQTTSVPAFGLEIGIGHTLQHLSTAFTPDGLRAMGAIVSSDQFKNRWDMGNSEEVANAIREALTTRNAFQTKVGDPLKRLLKKSMVTNKMGDCVPSLLIGQGIYRSFVRQGLAAEEAMNRTWEIINRTQQTNQMDNKSMMQRRSKYGNLITQFQSCVRQYLAYEIAAVRQFAAQPTDLKNAASLARATFLTCGVLPSLYYLGGVLWGMILGQKPDDDFLDDWVKSVLISNTASLYGWGLMMDGIVSEAFFAKKGKEPIIPAMQIANSFVRGISRMGYDLFSMAPMMWGDNPDADLDDFVDDAIKWLKGLNAPVRDALKAKENYDL